MKMDVSNEFCSIRPDKRLDRQNWGSVRVEHVWGKLGRTRPRATIRVLSVFGDLFAESWGTKPGSFFFAPAPTSFRGEAAPAPACRKTCCVPAYMAGDVFRHHRALRKGNTT